MAGAGRAASAVPEGGIASGGVDVVAAGFGGAGAAGFAAGVGVELSAGFAAGDGAFPPPTGVDD
ncbi:MAG: hypothetical protein O7D34_12225 [Ignavibacteria bacterium]|nr:hypothetical protein [Ignavibacteria bacterium]